MARYRPNVGAVIFSPDMTRVWLGRRAKSTHGEVWQFPQGGIDEGEELQSAARRECQEETGMTSLTFLRVSPEPQRYDFPADANGAKVKAGFNGQEQHWVAFRFEGDESEIDLTMDNEFDAWRWGVVEEAPDLVSPFKKEVYTWVVDFFKDLQKNAILDELTAIPGPGASIGVSLGATEETQGGNIRF